MHGEVAIPPKPPRNGPGRGVNADRWIRDMVIMSLMVEQREVVQDNKNISVLGMRLKRKWMKDISFHLHIQ
ncbi:unnamed protein product [Prunus armeniaca]|uniref:Uncharacterized protein n=1 Tax=Prunus armeniaca TaxID=36596 RepID=A0A6J5V915_PRUAR|nr:unnamed protein product [Prunus armeniaca]